jgi:cobalt/nickel transport protein
MPETLATKRLATPAPRLKATRFVLSWSLVFTFALPALVSAHFQELIPSSESLSAETGNRVNLELRFTHPMERGPVMDMGEPVRFEVLGPGGAEDLKGLLKLVDLDGKRGYQATHEVKRPGDHVYFIEPAAYWEPAEGVLIVHFAKVVVNAFDEQTGWDRELGLPVELVPLVRPYGLWTGNLFRALVKKGGQPVPFAEVEVEWRNDGSVTPPTGAHVTQVIKADAQGVFSYAMPRAGWWGFAALMEGDEPMTNPEGAKVPVEQGALMWVQVQDMR